MPEEEHSMSSRQEPGTVNDVGHPSNNGLNHNAILRWVIFEISILNDDDVSCRRNHSRAERSALALIHGVIKDTYRGNPSRLIDFLQKIPCPIRGAVIDDNDLFIKWSTF